MGIRFQLCKMSKFYRLHVGDFPDPFLVIQTPSQVQVITRSSDQLNQTLPPPTLQVHFPGWITELNVLLTRSLLYHKRDLNSGIVRWKRYIGQGMWERMLRFWVLWKHCTLKYPWFHQQRSPNCPLGILGRLHYTTMTD